jgi:hypothetical protein
LGDFAEEGICWEVCEERLCKSLVDVDIRGDGIPYTDLSQLDCHHGFASARSDYSDARLAGRVGEAYEVLAKFFEETL